MVYHVNQDLKHAALLRNRFGENHAPFVKQNRFVKLSFNDNIVCEFYLISLECSLLHAQLIFHKPDNRDVLLDALLR